MILPLLHLAKVEPVKAAFEIARADRRCLDLLSIFGIPRDPVRVWRAGQGDLLGGGKTARWWFSRDGGRLLTFGHLAPRPYAAGELGDAELSRTADRLTAALFPTTRWNIRPGSRTDGGGWDPPGYTRKATSADEGSEVRGFVMQIARATGRPFRIMIDYRNPAVAERADSGNGATILTVKLGSETIPPP